MALDTLVEKNIFHIPFHIPFPGVAATLNLKDVKKGVALLCTYTCAQGELIYSLVIECPKIHLGIQRKEKVIGHFNDVFNDLSITMIGIGNWKNEYICYENSRCVMIGSQKALFTIK